MTDSVKYDEASKAFSKQKERYEEFMDAFGHTLIEWQFVEAGLYMLFQSISGLEGKLASAIFFSVSATHARLKLTDEVAKVRLKDEALTNWNAVAKNIRTQANARNAIAHGVHAIQGDGEGGWVPAVGRLGSAFDPKHQWDAKRMQTAREAFTSLNEQIYAFGKSLSPSKPPEP